MKKIFTKYEFVTRHNVIKLMSVLFAVVVWFYIKGEATVQFTKIASIEVDVNKDMVVLNKSVEKIVVALKGNKDDMVNIRNKEVKAKINLRKYAKKSTINITLDKSYFNVSSQIAVTSISPPSIEITIDKLVEKVLPVKVFLSGMVDTDHSIGKIYTNPKLVKVRGPESKLRELKTIETEALDITGRVKSFSEMIPLQSLFSEEKKKIVNVYVQVKEKLSERNFSNIPINILNSPAQNLEIKLSSSQAGVTASGPKEALEKLTQADIKPFISVAGLSSGIYELPLQMLYIKDIQVIKIEPKVIKVNIGVSVEIPEEV